MQLIFFAEGRDYIVIVFISLQFLTEDLTHCKPQVMNAPWELLW